MTDFALSPKARNTVLMLLQGMFFLTLFFMSLSFRTRSYGNASLDWQVLLRLGFIFASLGLCAILYKAWYKQVLRLDNLPLTALVLMFVASSVYAPNLSYSLGAAVSVLVFILLPFTCLPLLGTRRTLGIVIAVTTFTQILGIIVYFALPEIGHAKVWQGAHQVLSSRMAGLTGPNGVGAAASLVILLVYFTYISFGGWRGNRLYYLACTAINVVALVMCNSRTAMAVTIFGLGFSEYMRKATPVRLGFLFIGLAALVLAASVVDYNHLFSMISRSGNADEITTGTGRTLIWQKCIELTGQRPLTGWGYASTSFILPTFRELGDGAPHCHDIYLQLGFTVGVLGPLLYGILILTKLVQSLHRRDIFRLCLIVMSLMGGVMEAGAFAGVANVSTLFLGLIAANEYLPRRETERYAGPASPQGETPDLATA